MLMSENSRPNFHPSSAEGKLQAYVEEVQEAIRFKREMIVTYEAEISFAEEAVAELTKILNSLPESAMKAPSLPVYSKGYSSMQAQAEAHAAQVRAEDSFIAQGRAMKDNPQA